MPTTFLAEPSDVRLAGELPDIKPIALVHRAEPFDDDGSVFEPQYDGLRGLVYSSELGCEIRLWPDVTFDRLGELRNRVREVLGRREAILDGQVVALNRQGKPVFPDLIRGQGFIAFAAFDLLWLDGADLRPRPLSERKRLLAELLPEDTGPLYKILTLDQYGRALFGAITKMDLEGIVAKRKADPYGAETVWYKIGNPVHGRGNERARSFRPKAASLPGRPSSRS
jgi:bifunctional non-homologous end joining protein LigD